MSSKPQPSIEEMADRYIEQIKERFCVAKSYPMKQTKQDFLAGAAAQRKLDEERVKGLLEALEFYANELRYQGCDVVDGVEILEICEDEGGRATAALEQYRSRDDG